MNILDFYKVNNFLNKYFGFSFPTLKKVVAKCLKLIWNHSGIISGAYFSPFQGVYYLYRGLRRAPKPYFGLILEYWIIFLFFSEWIFFWISWTLLNEYFFEWIFWILFWIEFWIESFLGPIQWKNEFSKRIEQGYGQAGWSAPPHLCQSGGSLLPGAPCIGLYMASLIPLCRHIGLVFLGTGLPCGSRWQNRPRWSRRKWCCAWWAKSAQSRCSCVYLCWLNKYNTDTWFSHTS